MPNHSDILNLNVKFRHVKMWLLHKRGLSRKEIADLLGGTNRGAVGNEIKKYEKDPSRQKMAEAMAEAMMDTKVGVAMVEETLKKADPPPTKEERKAARPISRATNAPSNPPDSSPAYLMTLMGVDNGREYTTVQFTRGGHMHGTGTKLNPANASTPEGGGLLVGVKHTPQGRGIEVETPEGKIKAEGGEILLNAKTSERLCETLSAESVKDGGVAFPCDKSDAVQGPMKGKGGMAGDGTKIPDALPNGTRVVFTRTVITSTAGKKTAPRTTTEEGIIMSSSLDATNVILYTIQFLRFNGDIALARVPASSIIKTMAGDGAQITWSGGHPQGGEYIKKANEDGTLRSSRVFTNHRGKVIAARTFVFNAPLGQNSGGIRVEYPDLETAKREEGKWVNMAGAGTHINSEDFVYFSVDSDGAASDGSHVVNKPYYTLTKDETIAERDYATGTRRTELNRHSIAEWGMVLEELK